MNLPDPHTLLNHMNMDSIDYADDLVARFDGQSKTGLPDTTALESTTPKINYPKGDIEYPAVGNMPKLIISDPKSEYNFEDFELSITWVFDDGTKKTSNKMVLGWRGSIRGYVKVYSDSKKCNYKYGFKQIINDRNDNRPDINVGVKYHDQFGNIITPIFSDRGDEKVTEADLEFTL